MLLFYLQNTYASFLNFNNENIKALHISPGACTFNTGVFVINVTEWRRQDITKKLDSWVKLSERYSFDDLLILSNWNYL